MKIGYHSANVIYRYDPWIILAQGSCVSWEAGTQCGTGLGGCRQTETVSLIPTLREGPVTAWSDHGRFGMVPSNVRNANTKNHVNLSRVNIDV